jgi:hypothetical protein
MNSEQQELVDLAYKNYIYNPDYKAEGVADLMSSQAGQLVKCPTQEDFITECKTDSKFSEKWGLKIEERELSLEERYKIALPIWKEKYGLLANMMVPTNVDNTPYKIPTKLITMTYNDKTIESYEQ